MTTKTLLHWASAPNPEPQPIARTSWPSSSECYSPSQRLLRVSQGRSRGIRERAALQLTSLRATDACPRSASLPHAPSRPDADPCHWRGIGAVPGSTGVCIDSMPNPKMGQKMQAAIPDGQELIIRPPWRMRAAWLL
eukprot:5627330-Amphidinium_carterae.1